MLIYPLFTKLNEQRFSLNSLNGFISKIYKENSVPVNELKLILNERITLLMVLIEVLAEEKATNGIEVLDAILYHKRSANSLLHIMNSLPANFLLTPIYLQKLLSLLEIGTTPMKSVKQDRRVLLLFQQKGGFLLGKAS